MCSRKSISLFVCCSLYLVIAAVAVSCTPAAMVEPPAPVEAATPTPEVFNPLNPSPTPSDSTLPLTCQITDLNVYVSEEWGFCFAYPADFAIDESIAADGIISLYGPALEENADPVRVTLELITQPVSEGSALTPLVNAYASTFQNMSLPTPISRESIVLGGEPAEKLEPVPGQLSSRVLMALHENILFTLRFHPSDLEIARAGLDALTQTVTGSFAYLPVTDQPDSGLKTVSWLEFGQEFSLSYDSILAPWMESQTVPAVPVSDQILYSESHPAYAQIRFLGFQGGMSYQLPILPVENSVAQVIVFETADFTGFGDDHPQGFVNQLDALKKVLESGVNLAFCTQPLTGEAALPFLPWVNSKQSLCAQPEVIEFANGKGIRYLTYYSQGVNPVMEQQVFYTFQGLTDDGNFYVSALFPVRTGIFPTEPPPCPKCGEPDYDPFAEWKAEITEQLVQLNAMPEDDFAPSLVVLDNLIQSIRIRKP